MCKKINCQNCADKLKEKNAYQIITKEEVKIFICECCFYTLNVCNGCRKELDNLDDDGFCQHCIEED